MDERESAKERNKAAMFVFCLKNTEIMAIDEQRCSNHCDLLVKFM